MSKWQIFIHPHGAYRLEYPAHWEYRIEEDGKSCGFGPRERDDVGLWISILPASLDTDRFAEDLPRLFDDVLTKSKAVNPRSDDSLRHHCMKADIASEGQGGHYWLIAGGDLVLFASSQVPAAERETWNPEFDRLMVSLHVTREQELLMRKVANDVLLRLRELRPEQDYRQDEKGIRGQDHMVYLGNLFREVRSSPKRRDKLVKQFVEGLTSPPAAPMGAEEWDEIDDRVVPVLKPQAYVNPEGPTRHLLATSWLADVVICYVIRSERAFRFITGWDCNRWGIDEEKLHTRAMQNLAALEWPHRLEGVRQEGGGRLILVTTGDSFAASRLLHPDFHRLLAGPLGSPFLAGIPDRDTLVTFSNKRSLRKRVAKQVRKDHNRSAYPITPQIFLVTADGIALASDE